MSVTMRKFPTITKGEMHVSIVRVPIAFLFLLHCYVRIPRL